MNTIKEQAALAAMQSLLTISAANYEDIVNDALIIGEDFERQFNARQQKKIALQTGQPQPEFVPIMGETYFFPRPTRSGFMLAQEPWRGNPNQEARRGMHFCYNDEMDCFEMCKKLNYVFF